jgi:hypothetical protein
MPLFDMMELVLVGKWGLPPSFKLRLITRSLYVGQQSFPPNKSSQSEPKSSAQDPCICFNKFCFEFFWILLQQISCEIFGSFFRSM